MMHLQFASNLRWNDRYPRINELVGELHQRKPAPLIHVEVFRTSCIFLLVGVLGMVACAENQHLLGDERPVPAQVFPTRALQVKRFLSFYPWSKPRRFPEAIRNLDPITQLYVSMQPSDFTDIPAAAAAAAGDSRFLWLGGVGAEGGRLLNNMSVLHDLHTCYTSEPARVLPLWQFRGVDAGTPETLKAVDRPGTKFRKKT